MALGLVATWNGTASSAYSGFYVNRVDRGAWGNPRSVDLDVPGRAGSWHFTEQRGLRQVSVTCTLVASAVSARRDSLAEVFDWIDVIGRKELYFSDQTDRYWSASLSSGINVDEAVRLGRFTIQFDAEPYALASALTEECFTGVTVPSDSDTFSMTGPVSVDPEITIVPTGGTLTAFTLTVNGDALSWSGTVANGATLTISSISSTVLQGASGDTMLTGAFDTSALDMTDVSGFFPVLVPGTNSWSIADVTGGCTSLTICFKYRKRYH